MGQLAHLIATIQDLLDSADQEGCTPDLAVVDAHHLLALAEVAGLPLPEHICVDPYEEEVA